MKTHADAIKALGFEFNNKTGSWYAPHAEGIIVRFKRYANNSGSTRITSRAGTATLSGDVSPEAVNQLVAAMMRNLKVVS